MSEREVTGRAMSKVLQSPYPHLDSLRVITKRMMRTKRKVGRQVAHDVQLNKPKRAKVDGDSMGVATAAGGADGVAVVVVGGDSVAVVAVDDAAVAGIAADDDDADDDVAAAAGAVVVVVVAGGGGKKKLTSASLYR